VFAYGSGRLTLGGFSRLAGAVALSILMLPTIMLTSEDAIRMVPAKMREAAIGMGCDDDANRLVGCSCRQPSRHRHGCDAGARPRSR